MLVENCETVKSFLFRAKELQIPFIKICAGLTQIPFTSGTTTTSSQAVMLWLSAKNPNAELELLTAEVPVFLAETFSLQETVINVLVEASKEARALGISTRYGQYSMPGVGPSVQMPKLLAFIEEISRENTGARCSTYLEMLSGAFEDLDFRTAPPSTAELSNDELSSLTSSLSSK